MSGDCPIAWTGMLLVDDPAEHRGGFLRISRAESAQPIGTSAAVGERTSLSRDGFAQRRGSLLG